jgi:hypothetical protein
VKILYNKSLFLCLDNISVVLEIILSDGGIDAKK